jgi:hypothetical protein
MCLHENVVPGPGGELNYCYDCGEEPTLRELELIQEDKELERDDRQESNDDWVETYESLWLDNFGEAR